MGMEYAGGGMWRDPETGKGQLDLISPQEVAEQYVAKNAALGVLQYGLSRRRVAPCRVVFVGSSTTAGEKASAPELRYVNLLVGFMQQAYPSGLGAEAPVVTSTSATWGTPSPNPGVHGYNAGQGGTTTTSYLTTAEIGRIAALKPRAIFHMVGSNDWDAGDSEHTFKANLSAKLTELQAALTEPCVQVLIHSYPKAKPTNGNTVPWSAYRRVLHELTKADPASVAFIDLSAAYESIGVPGPDPFGILFTDFVHQLDAGHAFMADLLRTALGIPSGTPAAAAPEPDTTVVLTPVTSDGFSGDRTNLVGTQTDAALGGTAATWQGVANLLKTTSGQASRGSSTATGFVCVSNNGATNRAVRVKITALSADMPYPHAVVLFRDAISGATKQVRAEHIGTQLKLAIVGSATTPYTSPAHTIAAGDVIELRTNNGAVEMRRNGTLLESYYAPALIAGMTTSYSGFVVAEAAAVGYDDFVVYSVVHE